MPDDGAAPESPAMDASEPSPGSDEAVAQTHFDEWSANVEHQISELRQSVAHLVSSMQSGAASHASGHAAAESSGAPGTSPRESEASAGSAGAGLSDDYDDFELEHSPKSAHRWWRPLRG